MLPNVVATQQGNTIVASIREKESVMAECVRAGLEVRYRFSLRVCSRLGGWFDPCKNKRDDIRSIEFDPITNQYLIQKDRLGDNSPPTVLRVKSPREALATAQSTDPFTINFLAYGDSEFLARQGVYIEVRSRGYCKNGQTDFENIINILTFDLLEANRFDTGWESFNISVQ
jgi:hypothetical protein